MSTAKSADAGRRGRRLVVVPSDPIAAYEEKGRGELLRDYYNPEGFFDEVFALSPLERGVRRAHGMTIEGVSHRDFSRRLRALRPDAVRAYGAWPAELCARRRVGRVPVAASVHATLPRMIRPTLRFADRVFCVSKPVADAVEAAGVDPRRIRLLPNRIDTARFRPTADARRLAELESRFPPGRRILFVGRSSPEKNRDTLIRALRHLPDDYRVIAIGHGDLEGDRRLAGAEGVAHRLHLVESVPNEALPDWLAFADCVCNPSRSEGFGIALIEAAACGAVVVTSDLPITRWLFEASRGACLVKDYEDPQALARALRRVCEDEDERMRLRENAVAAAAPFSKSLVDAREVELYRELIASGDPRPLRRLRIAGWQHLSAPLLALGRRLRAARPD